MTGLDLAAIRERANNATEGPWEADRPQVWGPNDESVAFVHHHDPGAGSGQPEWEANTEFIAAARTDIPALLDHVDTLTARLEAVRELHRPYTAGNGEQYCESCVEAFPWGGESIDYPCPTIQALDG